MSNYKYAIKKLPIKSWIKYWLWRNRTGGTKYKFALSDIKEGSNFYLENTIKRKFNIFEVYGKTTQDGTPTPENPIPIINLTGNINEKIQNKNFLPFANQDFTVNNVRYYVQDDQLYLNGTSSGETSTSNINFKNNFSFVLLAGTYYIKRSTDNISFALKKKSDDTLIRNTQGSFTLTEETEVYLGFYIYNKVFDNELIDMIVSIGSTESSYTPHQEQNISFPLAQGQVLAQGDYLADDGIHHKRGKVVFNGSEDWQKNTSFEKVFYLNNVITNRKTDIVNALSNYFIYGGLITSSVNVEEGKFYLWGNEQYISRIVLCINLSTLANLKTWLAEQYNNGTPVEIEYPLAEEVVEPFTEEQQEEYNKIKELYTYNEITNIDGDANLKIKYWERVER